MDPCAGIPSALIEGTGAGVAATDGGSAGCGAGAPDRGVPFVDGAPPGPVGGGRLANTRAPTPIASVSASPPRITRGERRFGRNAIVSTDETMAVGWAWLGAPTSGAATTDGA